MFRWFKSPINTSNHINPPSSALNQDIPIIIIPINKSISKTTQNLDIILVNQRFRKKNGVILMSHMCHGQNLGSSWARAFTGRRFHAILMWWVLCFPECQVPLVGVILCICPTWNWTPDIVLILGTDMGVQTFCAVSGVHCWQHRRNLLWLSLFMENRKPSGAYLQCSHVWLFTSWWIKTVCRVGSRGPMEQTLTVLLSIRNGTKTKWLVSHVSAACAAFGLFSIWHCHITLIQTGCRRMWSLHVTCHISCR